MPSPHPFQALYRRHYGFVWHAVRRFGVTPALTDDAVQDTFVTAFRRFDEIAMPTAKAWLYGIARRVASNYRRTDHRAARKRTALSFAIGDPETPRPELLLGLDRFLETLSGEDRELFVLSEIEGLSGPEAARALALNLSTTYSRVQSLRKRFRATLGDADPREVVRAARAERPRATTHGWALLSAKLGLSTATKAAPLALGGALAKVAVIALPIAVAIGVAVPAWHPARDAAASTAASDDRPGAHERSDAGRSPVAAHADPSLAPEPPPASAPARAPASAPAIAPSVARTPERGRPSQPPAADTDAHASLARHNRLLVDAAARLREGAIDEALALVEQHAREFPRSALSDARTALRIEALCAQGDIARARAEAHAFVETAPGSVVRGRIERSCVGTVVDLDAAGHDTDR